MVMDGTGTCGLLDSFLFIYVGVVFVCGCAWRIGRQAGRAESGSSRQ